MPIRIRCRDKSPAGSKELKAKELICLRQEIRGHVMRTRNQTSASYADQSNYCSAGKKKRNQLTVFHM